MTRSLRIAGLFAAALVAGCGGGGGGSSGKSAFDYGAPTAPTEVTPELAAGQLDAAVARIVQILNGITDESTARFATAPLRAGAPTLSAAGKQMLAVTETAEAAGKKTDPAAGGLPPQAEKLLTAVERVAKAPYGAAVRGELNGVIDAGAEMVPRADRPKYDEAVKTRGLRNPG